jgi:hypothetical protein
VQREAAFRAGRWRDSVMFGFVRTDAEHHGADDDV